MNPLEMQELIISDETPIINPIILKIVENEIKPKLYRDRRCLIAMRVVSFTILPDAKQEIE